MSGTIVEGLKVVLQFSESDDSQSQLKSLARRISLKSKNDIYFASYDKVSVFA